MVHEKKSCGQCAAAVEKKERNDVGGSAHSSYSDAHSWREGAFNGVYGQLKVFNANMNPHMDPNTTLPAVLPAPSGWEEI